MYYQFARGNDSRPVVVERERKSVGCERTFLHDLSRPAQLTIELYHLVTELVGRIERSQFAGRTLTLKVKFADFTQITRSITQPEVLTTKDQLLPLAKQLMRQVQDELSSDDGSDTHWSAAAARLHPSSTDIRLLGLTVSHSEAATREAAAEPMWIEGFLEFED